MPKEREVQQGRTRVQLDLSPEMTDMIEYRRRQQGVTRTAYVQNAIRVYGYLLKKASEGQNLRLDPADIRVIVGLPQNLGSTEIRPNPK